MAFQGFGESIAWLGKGYRFPPGSALLRLEVLFRPAEFGNPSFIANELFIKESIDHEQPTPAHTAAILSS